MDENNTHKRKFAEQDARLREEEQLKHTAEESSQRLQRRVLELERQLKANEAYYQSLQRHLDEVVAGNKVRPLTQRKQRQRGYGIDLKIRKVFRGFGESHSLYVCASISLP